MQAFEVRYYGVVQGVGFRWHTRSLARRHGILGTVENLPDGGVRLVCAADDAVALQSFLEELESDMSGNIRRKELNNMKLNDKYTSFEILL